MHWTRAQIIGHCCRWGRPQRLALRLALPAVVAVLLSACSGPKMTAGTLAPVPTPLPRVFLPTDKTGWEPLVLPGKLRTAFRQVQHEGRQSLHAVALGSASMLRQRVSVEPAMLGMLTFDWQVAQLIEGADMRLPEREDAPSRLVLAFDGDRSQFSGRNALLNDLTRALTGEDMPYATLMYVWSNDLPVETVIVNPRTDRIRKIVVESGPSRLRQWLTYRRDVRADFERAFGESPGRLQGLAVMTDADNTQSQAQAWYGKITLEPAP